MPYLQRLPDPDDNPPDTRELIQVAATQAGILAVRQAVQLVGEARVRSRIRRGRWRAVCRGIVALTTGRLSRAQQLWVAVLSAGRGAVLGGGTAATEAGVRGLPAEPLHVLLPANRHAPRLRLRALPLDMPAVVVHRSAIIPPEHLQNGQPWRTSTARSLVDAAAWASSTEQARLILAAGCQQRRVTPAEVHAVVAVLPKVRRRALIRQTVNDFKGDGRPLSDIDLVTFCRRSGLPSPDQRQLRRDGSGRTRYLGACWRQWRLRVEVDGGSTLDLRQDVAGSRRGNETWIGGERILRFPAWLVLARPTEFTEEIRRALLRAGWRPDS